MSFGELVTRPGNLDLGTPQPLTFGALQWIGCLQLDASPESMSDQIRKTCSAHAGLTGETLSAWWASDDPRLRTIAALGAVVDPRTFPGPSRAELDEVFSNILLQGNAEPLPTLSAFGLALLYEREQQTGDRSRITELMPLKAALDLPSTRLAALRALRAIKPTLTRKGHCLHSQYVFGAQFAKLITHPDLPVHERINVLRMLGAMETPVGHWSAQIIQAATQLLATRSLDREDIGFVVDQLVFNKGTATIARFVGDQTIPRDEREFVLQRTLQDRESFPFRLCDWQPILNNYVREPGFASEVIRLSQRFIPIVDWQYFILMSDKPDLPEEIRQLLYGCFWTHAARIEAAHQVRVLDVLLAHRCRPEELQRALERSGQYTFAGTVTPEQISAIMTLLRSRSEAPPGYLAYFARCVPGAASLTREDRKLVLDALIAGAPALRPLDSAELWTSVENHLLEDPSLGAHYVRHQAIPLYRRATFLCYDTSLAAAFDVAREAEKLEPKERHPVIYSCVRVLFKYVRDGDARLRLESAAQNNDSVWKQILTTDALISQDSTDLTDVVVDLTKPDLLRALAQGVLHDRIMKHDELLTPSLTKILDVLCEPGLPQDVAGVLSKLVLPLSRKCPENDPRSDVLIHALRDENLPVAIRNLILVNLHPEFLKSFTSPVWVAMSTSGDRQLRASLLERFLDAELIAQTPEAQRVKEQLQKSRTPEAISIAEKAWEDLGPIEVVFEADALRLLRYAKDGTKSTTIRESALRRFRECNLDSPTWRRLWSYAASAEGADLWESARLRSIVTRKLSRLKSNSSVRNVIDTGPQHPLWPALLKLIQFPDQSLVEEALDLFEIPDSDTWRKLRQAAPEIPEGALLAIHQVSDPIDGEKRYLEILRHAFVDAQSQHSVEGDLQETTIRVATKPTGIRKRITSVLSSFQAESSSATDVVQVARYAQLEAQLVARECGAITPDVITEPDLPSIEVARLAPIAKDSSAPAVAARLRLAVVQRLAVLFPGVDPSKLDTLIQRTVAPAIVAEHYRRIRPKSLPLLAEAVGATGSEDGWREWRFHRAPARNQLAHLADRDIEHWSQDLQMSVGVDSVPDDVRLAAETIRRRLVRALTEGEVPDEYARLFTDLNARVSEPVVQVRTLESARRMLGNRLGGKDVLVPPEIAERLPETLRTEIVAAIDAAKPEQSLLTLQRRIERTVDLIRLLNCDERALARNELRATGEPLITRGAGAVAYFAKLRRAFGKPATREQQEHGDSGSNLLDAALADAQAALANVKTFTTTKPLIAAECSDFRTLIEIGHRPYGQGSCQSYLASNNFNAGLLAYVADAMTKAIVVRTAPTADNPEGTLVARAIVKVGAHAATHRPVLVVEPTYAAGGESWIYDPMIKTAAKEFARQRGWRAAVPEAANGSPDLVTIPGSHNGVQYEDGYRAIVRDASPDSDPRLPEGPYRVRVSLLQSSKSTDLPVD